VAWLSVTNDIVLSRMTLTERSAFDATDINSAEPSRLATVIYYVTEMVRGKIAQSPFIRARMGPGPSGTTPGTIPSELMMATLNVIRYELFSGLPVGETILDKNRIQDYEDAKKDIAAAGNDDMGIQGYTESTYETDDSIVGGKYQIGWVGRTRPSTFVEDNPPAFGPGSGSGPGFPGT